MALKVNPDLLVRKVVKSLVHWSVIQGFDMDRSTPATQIDGGNGN